MSRVRAVLARLTRIAPMLAIAIVTATTAGWGWTRVSAFEERRFPHEKHSKLFPECETCHEGIMTGDSVTSYPSPSTCADCHDGTRQKKVDWRGHEVKPSNLVFSHAKHHREAEKDHPDLTCRSCHGTGGKSTYMAVARAEPELCIGCHTHKADGHLTEEAPCSRCHAPLARATRLSDSAVAAIPRPEWHDRPNFLQNHGPRAEIDVYQCSTCHARESCARCHPNAREVTRIGSLDPDARVARMLKGRAPKYFTPASHTNTDWVAAHGDSAKRQPQTCANCHAQPSCRTCHTGTAAARTIARLARPDPSAASGVRLLVAPPEVDARGTAAAFPHAAPATRAERVARIAAASAGGAATDTLVRTVRVHPPDFVDRHGPTASSGRMNCQGCHEERTCSNCHSGNGRRRFHAFNFVSRHAASAAGRERDCASCHNTETFCRECHRGQGREAQGARNIAYHDRQPLWLQQHGQAARLEMQSCASCHQQRDCMQCHSSIGLRVNPHGPGFDAERMAKRNRQLCLMCHVSDPLRSPR